MEKTRKLINLKLFFKSLLWKIIEIFVKNNYKNNLVVDKKYDRTPFSFWSVKTKLNGEFLFLYACFFSNCVILLAIRLLLYGLFLALIQS